MKVPHPLAASARGRPDAPALICEGQTLSYAALAEAAARAASGFSALGLSPGQRVALMGPPGLAWVKAFWGLHWLGASVAPLSARAPAQERLRDLAASEATALVCVEEGGAPPGWSGPLLRPTERDSRWAERDQDLDEERLVVLSSGSTGAPRPTPLSTGQLLFSAMGSALRLGHLPDDRWLACLPLHHVGGLSVLLRCALYGTCVELHPRFDAHAVAERLDSGEVQLVSLVPAMLHAVLDARPERPFPPPLRVMLIGGARTPRDLLARARRIQAPLSLTWGMTETGSQVSTRAPGDLSFEPHSGAPLPFARVRVRGGALAVEGPVAPGGRVVSGDRGALDEAGRVVVHGRRDAVIVSGGENIDPMQVEAALRAHPGVAEVVVLGRPDPRWGERPVAAYIPRDQPVPEEELRAWVRVRLADFKCPDRFVALEALPRTALGKVAQAQLRELLKLPPPASPAPTPEPDAEA